MRTWLARGLLSALCASLAAVLFVACGTKRAHNPNPTSLSPVGPPCSNVRPADGLELLILGSGGPRSAGRAASSYLFTLDGVLPRILVKTLILGHLPPKVDEKRDEVIASIRRSFNGEIRFAADCMQVRTGGH